MSELEVCRRLGLPLLYWRRVGDNPQEWKGPHEKGWNDPARVYDLRHYDPAIHNVGTFTGREVSADRFLVDVDLDKLNVSFAATFFPPTELVLSRQGKELSHIFYTTSAAPEGKREYLALNGASPYVELRGTRHQTMVPPSLHTPPDIRVQFKAANAIGHVGQLSTLEDATLNYAIACLVADAFPSPPCVPIRPASACRRCRPTTT
jgi:hypothetical protein